MGNMRLSFSLLLLILPAAVVAQVVPAPGDRVRITSKRFDIRRQDGRLISIAGDSVLVEVRRLRTIRYRDVIAPDTIAAPLAALDRIEVSRAGGRRTGRGALIGLSIGAVFGYMGGAGWGHCDDCIRHNSDAERGLMGAAALGAFAAGIGAVVGSGARWDNWEEIPRARSEGREGGEGGEGGLFLRPLPQGRMGVGLTLRF